MNFKELRKYKFGIASLILALLNIGIIIYITYQDIQKTASGSLNFTKQDLYITWLVIIGGFMGTMLGTIGIVKKEERKYAVNGLILNAILVLAFVFL